MVGNPKFSIGLAERGSLLDKKNVPGPGQYMLNSDKAKKPIKSGFGSSERKDDSSLGKDSPGPGAYKIPVKVKNVPQYANAKGDTKFDNV